MLLIRPDILDECLRKPDPVSLAVLVFGLVLGLLLWLLGGWGHRFYVVLVTTVVAGVVGLYHGRAWGLQPLVAGLMLGVAAGALALALARIVVFAGVGLLTLFLARIVAPRWDEPLACFLAGGLLGVLLFRFWLMVLASLGGTLLMAYSLLGLLGRLTRLDVVAWAEKNGPLLNWGCGSFVVLGVLMQLVVLRRKGKPKAAAKPAAPAPPPPKPAPPPPAPLPFWQRLLPQNWLKKAG